MLLADLRVERTRGERSRLATLGALAGTLALRRKADDARRTIEAWVRHCRHPALAVSGGKDSTLLLQLAHGVDRSLPVYRADGPVPLSDRGAHVAQLHMAAGGSWTIVPYTYDVEGVLEGDVRYPAGTKQRLLLAAMEAAGVDGIGMGLRAQESRGRQWNARTRGTLYRAHGGRWICTPLATWTADEVIGWLVATDALPLNPVYEHTYLLPDLNRLRDGTWLPNQASDAHGYRGWLSWHYPEHMETYDRAVRIFTKER